MRRRLAVHGFLATWMILGLYENLAFAHPVPAARATLELHEQRTFDLFVECDVSALVMQTTPGHLGSAAAELAALDDSELQARMDDARQAIEHYLVLNLNGKRQLPEQIEFPSLDVIRAGTEHGEDDTWPEIVLHGKTPADVTSCEIAFPASLGRVQLRLVQADELLLERELAAGESSGVLTIPARSALMPSRSLADGTGWIIVALLLAYLGWLVIHELRVHSRSTNTGQ